MADDDWIKTCEVTVKVRMDFGNMAYEQDVPVVVKYDLVDFKQQVRECLLTEEEFFDDEDRSNAHDQAMKIVQSRFDYFLRLGKQVIGSTNEALGEDSPQAYTFRMEVISVNWDVDHDCEEWAEEGILEQPSEYEPAGYLECGYPDCGEQLHADIDENAYENWRDTVLEKTEARKSEEERRRDL